MISDFRLLQLINFDKTIVARSFTVLLVCVSGIDILSMYFRPRDYRPSQFWAVVFWVCWVVVGCWVLGGCSPLTHSLTHSLTHHCHYSILHCHSLPFTLSLSRCRTCSKTCNPMERRKNKRVSAVTHAHYVSHTHYTCTHTRTHIHTYTM
jgi:hypothetical protein